MKGSAVQSTLRASLFYAGSALFMATGAVTIADQPFAKGPIHNAFICGACQPGGGGVTPQICAGYTCWTPARTNCSQLSCSGIPAACPF